jgi:NAD(P) transhydrogenase subunit alpha
MASHRSATAQARRPAARRCIKLAAKRAEVHRPNTPLSEENRTMLIGVPLETAAGKTRVAVTPETAKKLKARGHTLRVQSGAGVAASATDEAYAAAGAEITDRSGAFTCDPILRLRSPSLDGLVLVKTGAALVGMPNPFDKDNLNRLAGAGLTSFALEAAPRTTRAQSMDVSSSRANIAGCKTAMMAADNCQRLFPMLMTAVGGGASAPNT